jgi:hypothetical protein
VTLSRFIPLKDDVIDDTLLVREARVAGTNLGASFAGRLVFISEWGFAVLAVIPLRREGGTYLDDMI